jgi:hypothetical protein
MIIATSCLFAVLTSFAQANNVRSNIAHAEKQAVAYKRMTPREAAAKVALAKTGVALGSHFDSATLKNFRVVAQGESPLALGTAAFFTQSYKDAMSCASSIPDVVTSGYLTETCFTPDTSGASYSSFAYRCNTSKFSPSSCLLCRLCLLTILLPSSYLPVS